MMSHCLVSLHVGQRKTHGPSLLILIPGPIEQVNSSLSLSTSAIYVSEALTGSMRHCVDPNVL